MFHLAACMEDKHFAEFSKRNVTATIMPVRALIHSLPSEILVHILSYLSPIELCKTVPRVCRLWEGLHRDPGLYRTLSFSPDDSTKIVNKCMQFATSLRSFTLVAHSSSDMLKKLSLYNLDKRIGKQLRNFTLKLPLTTRVKGSRKLLVIMVFELINKCPYLHTLCLDGFYDISSEMLSHLSDPSLHPITLHLRVLHLTSFWEDTQSIWFNFVMKCVQLEEISIYCMRNVGMPLSLTGNQLTCLCERLCGKLRVLQIDYSGFGDGFSPQVLSSLTQCHRLQELYFKGAHNLSDEGLGVIASLSLRKLRIQCCHDTTEDGWTRLVTSPALKCLEYLRLDRCNVTNETIVAVGANLSNLKQLHINIPSVRKYRYLKCPVSNTGLQSIITGCPKLEGLSLSHINPVDTHELLLIPRVLPRLQTLAVYAKPDFEIPSEGVLMPYLRIDLRELSLQLVS